MPMFRGLEKLAESHFRGIVVELLIQKKIYSRLQFINLYPMLDIFEIRLTIDAKVLPISYVYYNTASSLCAENSVN